MVLLRQFLVTLLVASGYRSGLKTLLNSRGTIVIDKREMRNCLVAAVIGGFIGLHAFAIGYSLKDAINFSFMDVYAFKLPLLKATPEDRNRLMAQAEKLIAQGSELAYQRALYEHGLDGIGAGAGVGIMTLLSFREIKKYVRKKIESVE